MTKEKEQIKNLIGGIYEITGKEKQEIIDSIPLKKGAVVMIYEDPRTRKKPEGQAILVWRLKEARFKGDMEYWKVKFEDGYTAGRFIVEGKLR